MPRVKRGQRVRAYRPKTRTGCITCKRIKCDEAKPSCVKCTSTGRTCDGYSVHADEKLTSYSRKTVSYVITEPPPLSIVGSEKERRAFHFFRSRTVPQLAGFYGCEFWNRLVLQAAHLEPAIRHGIFALGSLHECFQNDGEYGTAIDQVDFPVQQYHTAIKQLISPLGQHQRQAMDIALASCIIFVCFETIRGHYGSALAHIHSGIKILCELQMNDESQKVEHPVLATSCNPYVPLEIFEMLYTRLDSQVVAIIGGHVSNLARRSKIKRQSISIPVVFTTVSEARDVLEYHWHNYLYYELNRLAPGGEEAQEACNARSSLYADILQQWSTALDQFTERGWSTFHTRDKIGALILQIQKCVAFVTVDVRRTFIEDQTLLDKYYPVYEKTVSLAESVIELMLALPDTTTEAPSFSPDNGIVKPLYGVVSACRDPALRRKAIALLRRISRQEGMWDSQVVARIAERVMAIEEEGFGVVRTCSDVPDWARISDVLPSFDVASRRALLSYGRFQSHSGSVRETVHEVLEW